MSRLLIYGLLLMGMTGILGGCGGSVESNSSQNGILDTVIPQPDPSVAPDDLPEAPGELGDGTEDPSRTGLPFGPSLERPDQLCLAGDQFQMELIGSNLMDQPVYTESYPLPPISTYEVVAIDSAHPPGACQPGTNLAGLLDLKSYKYQLPDQGKHSVYYVSDATDHTAYTRTSLEVCPDFSFQHYGFLVLVEAGTRHGRVLPIYASDFVDALVVRTFFIDEDYTVHLCENEFTSDEEGETEMTTYWTGTVGLMPDGSLNIQTSHS